MTYKKQSLNIGLSTKIDQKNYELLSVVVEPLWSEEFTDQILRVAWKMSKKPFKKLFS